VEEIGGSVGGCPSNLVLWRGSVRASDCGFLTIVKLGKWIPYVVHIRQCSTRLSLKSTDAQGITRAYQARPRASGTAAGSSVYGGAAADHATRARVCHWGGCACCCCCAGGCSCYLFPDRLPSATFSFPASTTINYLSLSDVRCRLRLYTTTLANIDRLSPIYQLRLFRAVCSCDVICSYHLIYNQSSQSATKHPAVSAH